MLPNPFLCMNVYDFNKMWHFLPQYTTKNNCRDKVFSEKLSSFWSFVNKTQTLIRHCLLSIRAETDRENSASFVPFLDSADFWLWAGGGINIWWLVLWAFAWHVADAAAELCNLQLTSHWSSQSRLWEQGLIPVPHYNQEYFSAILNKHLWSLDFQTQCCLEPQLRKTNNQGSRETLGILILVFSYTLPARLAS